MLDNEKKASRVSAKPKKIKLFFERIVYIITVMRTIGLKATLVKIKNRVVEKPNRWRLVQSFIADEGQKELQRNTKFSRQVKFSIIVPLYNTPLNFLEEMVDSVIAQTYSNWELCLADSSDKEHSEVGAAVERLCKKDSRIKYKKLEGNRGISENSNEGIKMASGNYLALLDHDDILNESALFEIMKAICEHEADFIYTDEMVFKSPKINNVKALHLKPDYAVDTLRAVNYICHFTAFSRELIEKVGGFRAEFDGSQDHDLFLRLTAAAENIVHVPKIMYYWRSHPLSVASHITSKSYAIENGKKAVKQSIEAAGFKAEVLSSRANPTMYRIKYELKSTPLVSIIIPNKNHYADLKKCIDSIFNLTAYNNYEIVIVDNGSNEKELFNYYDKLKKYKNIKICSFDIEFNYSKLNNYAADKADGDYYIFLNNDVEIITPEWIEEMLMYVQREDVGAAGAMLYYPNDTIQHAGVIIGLGGIAGHCYVNHPKSRIGYLGRLCYAQDISAVTAACMMVKASVFSEVGGLDEEFVVAYNDIDLCMKIRRADYLIVWTPYAEAYHYESKTRGYETTPEKLERFNNEKRKFQNKWKVELEKGDPYYNPNLATDSGDFKLKRMNGLNRKL